MFFAGGEKSTERKMLNVIRTVPVVLVVPGVWAPAGVRIINDVDPLVQVIALAGLLLTANFRILWLM